MSYVNETAVLSGLSNWLNGQIAAKVKMKDGNEYEFTDFIRMSVNRTSNYNVYHSVGKHNRGYIKLPKTYTYTLTIPVTSPDAQVFRMLFNGEVLFDFEYYDAHGLNNTGTPEQKAAVTEFKLVKEKLINCLVTAMNDSYEVEGIPMIVFNGTALSNDFVANIETQKLTGKNYGDNSLELSISDLDEMVDTNYWPLS